MRKIIAVLISVFILSTVASAELPYPAAYEGGMILGEATGDYYTEADLFFNTGNGTEYTSVKRTIYVPAGSTEAEAVLNALFKESYDDGIAVSMPGNAAILGMEYSCGMVTVDISIDITGLNDSIELIGLFSTITNTLTSVEGVQYVNILLNSRFESIMSLPVGLQSHSIKTPAAMWSEYQTESSNFASGITINRTAALYFPAANGQWLLPEIRTISLNDEDHASALMLELIKGTQCGDAYSSFLSGGISIMTAEPSVIVTPSGERILEIYLSGSLRDYLLLQGLSEWQVVGAITMTMCSFIPEIDGVRFSIDDQLLTSLNIRGRQFETSNAIFRRKDFSMYIGSTARLYFASEDDALCIAERAMSPQRALSPYSLIVQLISGPASADGDAVPVFPAGINSSDILGVSVKNGTAVLNMSGNFYRLCQLLNSEQERQLVYSIVNTLCELPDIKAVQIIIEGQQINTLSDSIHLIGELLPNPGIVK